MEAASRGFFPLDKQLELWERHWSPEICKQMVWLSGRCGSFEEAEETLARIGRIGVSDSSVWRRVNKWCPQFKSLEEAAMVLSKEPMNN